MKPALASLAALALSACMSVSVSEQRAAHCPAGAHATITAQLFFGRNIGNRLGVTDADWARFLDEEVSPRFPEGFTVLDANGQWRDADTRQIVREPSKVLVLVLDRDGVDRAAIASIVGAYRTRFQQQAVGAIYEPACVAF